ncbi:MAG: histidine phosphatase family protein [Rhodobacteraceae bacterium]|nr:histidine phosphatase family protein [Paracoccaceae bacterium]
MIIHKPFYYIRHGQTDWNVEGRYQGSKDIPLNETGVTQAHAAKSLMSGLPITHIYSSTLQRARVTADIVNEELNLPLTGMDGLQECNFGVLEGKLRPSNGGISESWRDGTTPDKAETYIAFTARVFTAINEVLENEGTPLIVAHGAVFWPVHTHMQLGQASTLPNAYPVHLSPPIGDIERWTLTEL